MRTRVLAIARTGLLVWGAFSLASVVGAVAFVAFQLGPGNRDKIDSASAHDVRFVLNGCELGDQRIEKVLHSYVSARSFTGDHLDGYAIKISYVELAELTKESDAVHGKWYRCDQPPKVVDDAISLVGGWLHEFPWFPSEQELRSPEIYVYPLRIYCYGVRPSAAELVFVRPADRMIFYFGGKT